MWTAVRSAMVVIGVAVTTLVTPPGVSSAAANLPPGAGIASIQPESGAVVGVAHPVVVTFNAPVLDRPAAERTIAVRTDPPMSGTFDWVENDEVHWVPDRYWPAHSTVALSVGKRSVDFSTGARVVGVASISAHTFTVTVDGEDAGPLPAPHHRPHWGEDGVLPATLGKTEYETPVGRYSVLGKDRKVVMDSSSVGIPIDDPEGYRFEVEQAVRITRRGLYVHSAPWALRSLGIENVSHGCIGLSPTDAEWYFDRVNIGDPVIIEK
ncbi:L,D-transpeptidase [[Mycobacterium] kokjensenii]|uniref:L,D-transpeptidase n=1 Tax=[Mycobacterium] kokjensenii TaxID=3064287 RepID=A0ABM9LLN5_9MYCO|nr:L,D-transpeptidase [Mycolicibacter sp. MU0083]CAJ1501144.1 L,D-transpeptidase [Mycolicibacter sp. MU0083]